MGEYCQHRDPCEKNRCQNGGTCVAQAMLGKATCRCALGFTGEDCQHSTTHPCFVSQPCLNGGTCHVLSRDTYECTCQVGFTGNQWDSGPHFPILSRYFHLVSFTIIWFFRVPPYSTCLSLWEGTGMFQSTIPNFLLKGEKEKAKGSNTPQWLTKCICQDWGSRLLPCHWEKSC